MAIPKDKEGIELSLVTECVYLLFQELFWNVSIEVEQYYLLLQICTELFSNLDENLFI